MGLASKIQWTDATWNPWQGCTKVSPACTNCYMFRDMKRYGRDGSIVIRSAPKTFGLPLNRKRDKSFAIPSGWKVFTCSWSDWFHSAADEWRPEAWEIIRQRPDVTFQIVTKRTERIAEHLPSDWGNGWPNVWLIATVENQEWADVRIPQLLSVPSAVHGLSCEPLLGAIDLSHWLSIEQVTEDGHWRPQTKFCGSPQIEWIITGGESGPGSRPTNPDWLRDIRDQCQAAEVPYFHKQHGEWVDEFHVDARKVPNEQLSDAFVEVIRDPETGLSIDYRGVYMAKVGTRAAGREIDGREWSEFPKSEVLA